MRFIFILIATFLLSNFLSSAEKTKIVLIAGNDSHKHGDHEHLAGCSILAKCLNASKLSVEVVVTAGWPSDMKVFDGAKAIVVFANGNKQHPLNDHFEYIDKLADKGVGIGLMHFALEVEVGKTSEYLTKWIGGFYEDRFSTNPNWKAACEINREHVATRGVKNFNIRDEWFFNFRFVDPTAIVPLITAIPDENARSGKSSHPKGPYAHIVKAKGKTEVLAWAFERQGGGRGMGFGGAHHHGNWRNDNFRKVVINTIAWLARIEIPQVGIVSKTPTNKEMRENLSPSPVSKEWIMEKKALHKSKPIYRSKVLKVKDKLVSTEVDLAKANELILVALDGGDGIENDHCAWVNPVLSGSKGVLDLTGLKWEISLASWGSNQINKDIYGEKLNGIATHALSIIRYKIPKGYDKLKVSMGLLGSSLGKGSVQFEIYTR